MFYMGLKLNQTLQRSPWSPIFPWKIAAADFPLGIGGVVPYRTPQPDSAQALLWTSEGYIKVSFCIIGAGKDSQPGMGLTCMKITRARGWVRR